MISYTRAPRSEREEECELTYHMCVRACLSVSVSLCVCICKQDPPNGALSCKMDGVATTTVITITNPEMMTDERGVMSLTYDADLVSMTRGGPTAANMSAPAEEMAEEQVIVCDEGSGVSLYIDDVSTPECPSPMSSAALPQGLCIASNRGSGTECADGWAFYPICESPPYYCIRKV